MSMAKSRTIRGTFQLAKGGAMVGGLFIPDTFFGDGDVYNGKMVEIVGVFDVVQGQAQPKDPSTEGYVQTFEGSRSVLVELQSIRVVD